MRTRDLLATARRNASGNLIRPSGPHHRSHPGHQAARRAGLRLVHFALLTAFAACGPLSRDSTPTGSPEPSTDAAPVTASLPAPPHAPGAPGAEAGWLSQVQARIARGEYALQTSGDSFQAFNRAQHLQGRFSTEGLELAAAPGSPYPSDWSLGLAFTAWGREGSMQLAEPVAPAPGGCLVPLQEDEEGRCLRRLEYERAGIVEWWENRTEGLEQGWTVESRPVGEGPLVLEVSIEGLEAEADVGGEGVALAGGGLRYAGLSAWDADGEPLSARMEAEGGRVRIEVEDAGAAWPVTIDPLLTTAAWSQQGEATGNSYGTTVSTAGDVNGDGYADVIVGAHGYSSATGKAYLYLGASSGLGTTAVWSQQGDATNNHYGISVSTAGDVNGDGYADAIVGAYGYSGNTGKAYLYLGASSGLGTTAAWSQQGDATGIYYGHAVSTAGDVNGDGYADVIVGADGYSSDTGKAYLYLGTSSGLGMTAVWSQQGETTSSSYGSTVSTAGDVNGDGYADVIVGAHGYSSFTGKAYLYLGASSGLGTTAAWSRQGEATYNYYGLSASTAGDVNGDGYADVIVGAYGYSSKMGKAYLYLGSASGLGTSAAWSQQGAATDDIYGRSVSTAGDVNGDGYADAIVGAPQYSSYTGKAYLYLGASSGLGTTAAWSQQGAATNNFYGNSVSTAGDVNGDGYADVIVGSYGYSSSTGKAYLYLGASSGLGTTATWSRQGEAIYNYYGLSVSTAGDVNGDGYADVIVGAHGYSSYTGKAYLYLGASSGLGTTAAWSQQGEAAYDSFGFTVSTAGDVNGDGYADVIVGSYRYSSYTGKAYLYLGASSGLGTTAAWSQQGEAANNSFGFPVSTAGDVNGDGYADVIVGANGYSSKMGKAYLYLGAASGLGTSAAWSQQGEAVNNYYARSVSTAGDVNGDGYADVIVGAAGYSVEPGPGKAYLYLGSASGLGTSAAWSQQGAATSYLYGTSVSTSGDVNGDGYADVIVGAPGYGNNVGKAYLYLGASSGLGTTAAWSQQGAATNSLYGNPVSTAGDVNGDGYADVIVGAQGYSSSTGKAYLYLGAASGLGTTAAWSQQGEAAGNFYGISVSTAGDVNGDGYTDVIVGAYGYSTNTGKAYLYLGNGGDGTGVGLPLRPQTLRTDLGVPIQPWGRSDAINAVGVASLSARSPFGRTKLRLQVEIKPRGTAFNFSALQSSAYADSTTAGVALKAGLSGLSAATDYHWRARIQYLPGAGLKQGWSRWLYGGLPGDARGVHVRTCPGSTFYRDADGDTFGSATNSIQACTQPSGYVADSADCDDSSASVYPGAKEVAGDGIDQDCDAKDLCYTDADNDNYGTSVELNGLTLSCTDDSGRAPVNGDCDDNKAAVRPGATETCNTDGSAPLDEDCDGKIDDADDNVTGQTEYYRDADGDGYGTASVTVLSCSRPAGYASTSTDCNDSSGTIYPGATESCNNLDDNCNGQVDDGAATQSYYQDSDGDGYGNPNKSVTACSAPEGTVSDKSDCDDTSASIHPGAPEQCNGVDDNCNGQVDDGVATQTYYEDVDGDGYGISGVTRVDCTRPPGFVALAGDCDDTDPAIHPGVLELCNGKDDDCDRSIDEGVQSTFYADTDKDGYGNPSSSTQACSAPAGYVKDNTDCDDGDPDTYPGAPEQPGGGIDRNCDGAIAEASPTPDPSPSPTPAPDASPTPDAGASPTPEHSPSPEPSPEASPTPGGGSSPEPSPADSPSPGGPSPESSPVESPTPSQESPTPSPATDAGGCGCTIHAPTRTPVSGSAFVVLAALGVLQGRRKGR